jgi:hypothetical protein
MQVLKDKDDALYTRLVRLAGGDSAIVMDVLSRPKRPSVSLTTVIREIEDLRDRKSARGPTVPAAAAG